MLKREKESWTIGWMVSLNNNSMLWTIARLLVFETEYSRAAFQPTQDNTYNMNTFEIRVLSSVLSLSSFTSCSTILVTIGMSILLQPKMIFSVQLGRYPW